MTSFRNASVLLVYRSRSEAGLLPYIELVPGVYSTGLKGWLTPANATAILAYVSGCGRYGNVLLDECSPELEEAQALDLGRADAAEISAELSGAVALTVLRPELRRVEIISDPMGMAMIYVYKGPHLEAASTDLSALVGVLEAQGIRLTKSLHWAVEGGLLGNGAFASSSYEEIVRVEPLCYVRIDSDGVVMEPIASLRRSFFYPAGAALEETADLCVLDLRMNVAAVARRRYRRLTAHLTGGFDSRLGSLALAEETGRDVPRFYCQGPDSSEEKRISQAVAGEFGLTLTNDPGVASIWVPSDYGGALTDALARSDGVSRFGAGLGATERPDSVVISGGYGELLRSFYGVRGKPFQNSPSVAWARETAEAVWSRRLFGDSREALLGVGYQHQFAVDLARFAEEAVDCGVRPDAVLDYLYVWGRARTFVGQVSHSWSSLTPRFDVLYSLGGAAGALALPQRLRSENALGLEVLKRIEPRGLIVPFNSAKFSGDTLLAADAVACAEHVTRLAPLPTDSGPSPIMMDTGLLPRITPTKEDKQRASVLGVSAKQVALAPYAQQELRDIIGELPADVSRHYFSGALTDRLLHRQINNRNWMRKLYTLYGSLCWYSGRTNA